MEFTTTPGQVIGLTCGNYQDMIELSNLIIDKIGVACISNALSLTKKFILTKEDVNGFDIIVFIRLMRKILFDRILKSSSKKYIDAYNITYKFYKDLLVVQYNKKYLFQNVIKC